jgi:predicted TIM-barrel fold metal-dependent hydrolase
VDLDVPDGVMAGIVARADLALGEDVREVVEAHLAAAGSRLRGIRYSTAWAPGLDNADRSAGLLSEDRVRAGVAALARYALPLDCWLYGHQLDELADLAAAFPDQVFVLDHLGTPLLGHVAADARSEVLKDWRGAITRVAARPNVRVKIGGLAMHLMGAPWTVADPPSSEQISEFWRTDVSSCIDAFSPARCMFESNFPIDGMVVDYVTLWNAHKRLSEAYSPDERRAMLSGTAQSVYLPSL